MNPTILHADFNSYFATVEQQKNPQLRGKPIGITKGPGRGCVIAASVEAKRQGVKTGDTVWDAKTRAPNLLLVPADFDSYLSTTKAFEAICSRYTDGVELFSLDEVFMDLTHTARLFGDSKAVALRLKHDLARELGHHLTVSIGIARNRLLAKLASNMEKPDGLVEITDANQDDYLGRAQFNQICGVGPRLEKRLKAIGVTQLLQIRQIPDHFLQASFGPHWSLVLKQIAWGHDSAAVARPQLDHPKSVSRTFTLYRDVTDQEKVLATLRNLVEEATEKLRLAQLAGRQFGLMVRGHHHNDSRFVTRKRFTNDPLEVFRELKQLYRGIPWRGSVRFLGVWVSLLEETTNLTSSLFPEVQRRQRLLAAQDQANSTFGHYTVFPASLLHTQIVYPEVNGYLGDEAIKNRIASIK